MAEGELPVGRGFGGVGGRLRDGAVLPEDEEVVGLEAVDGDGGGRHVDAVANLHRDAAACAGEPTLQCTAVYLLLTTICDLFSLTGPGRSSVDIALG